MLKKISIILITILLLVGLSGNVLATDKYTTISTINGVTANWEYELNESNQIENLKCTNPADLTGSITIPSTLDGKTVISLANEAFKTATSITEVTMPSTVKEIGLWAFSGCTSLSKVNLGNVEKISDQSFKNCTALTSIKLPKTLTKDASGAPFSGCTNLKNIELEEGMTVVPNYVCASTAITEITIPSTVKEIGMWAFKDCSSLKKITILDNVENMEGYNSSNSDLVFQNHNDDLTIYCYKDSMAAKYAIKYNIKYVYLTKPSNPSTEEPKKEDTETQKDDTITDTKKDTDIKDTTVATGKLPQTGATMTGIFVVLVISIASIIFYIKYRKFRDI